MGRGTVAGAAQLPRPLPRAAVRVEVGPQQPSLLPSRRAGLGAGVLLVPREPGRWGPKPDAAPVRSRGSSPTSRHEGLRVACKLADVFLPLAIPFPKSRNEAQPLFRHCVQAPWCQVADIPGAMPAYTEMFLASPAVVRLWVAQLGAEPQWLCL